MKEIRIRKIEYKLTKVDVYVPKMNLLSIERVMKKEINEQ